MSGRHQLSIDIYLKRYITFFEIYQKLKEQLKDKVSFKEEVLATINGVPIIKVVYNIEDNSLDSKIKSYLKELIYKLNYNAKMVIKKSAKEEVITSNISNSGEDKTLVLQQRMSLVKRIPVVNKLTNVMGEAPKKKELIENFKENFNKYLKFENQYVVDKDFILGNTASYIMRLLYIFLFFTLIFPIIYNYILLLNQILLAIFFNMMGAFKNLGVPDVVGFDLYVPIYLLNLAKNEFYFLAIFIVIISTIFFFYNTFKKGGGVVEKIKIKKE